MEPDALLFFSIAGVISWIVRYYLYKGEKEWQSEAYRGEGDCPKDRIQLKDGTKLPESIEYDSSEVAETIDAEFRRLTTSNRENYQAN